MTSEQGTQLQKECKELAQPYIEILADIHQWSTFRMLFSPDRPKILPTIIWPDDERASVVLEMKRAVSLHIIKRTEERK